jgi:hypothetical protein
MGFVLPALLLGLAQPVDQPVTPVVPETSSVQAPNSNAELQRRQGQRPFDRIEPQKDNAGPSVCLTMRSYYFERHDDMAPELKGMTTCEYASEVRERNARKRHPARLVPATDAESGSAPAKAEH